METELPLSPNRSSHRHTSHSTHPPEIHFANALIEYAIRELSLLQQYGDVSKLPAVIHALEKAKLEAPPRR